MAIKSFVSAKVEDKSRQSSQILVADIMTTNLIVFHPDQSVIEVMASIVKNKISGGPVVDSQGQLIGIISEGDCIKEISDSRYYNMPMASHKVHEFMVKDVDVLDSNMDIFEVCSLFQKNKRRRFPVMRDGKLVGQISQIDVLKAILEAQHQAW
ncbi:MAG: CBS domain-containing protein [Flavobacteriaceae bacterium]